MANALDCKAARLEWLGNGIGLGTFVHAATSHTSALVPTVPQGTDAHCETEIRIGWNEENQTNEVHELVYEVSWIPELLAWRRFLLAHRIVSSGEGQLNTSRR